MSRVFTDEDLLTWEAFTTSGRFGMPERSKIVFQCLTDPDRRARQFEHDGDGASAQRILLEAREDSLREMLRGATELR